MNNQHLLSLIQDSYPLFQIMPSMVHELNNIFTAILSTAQLMIEFEEDPEELKRGYLDIQNYIQRGVELTRIINLHFFQQDPGKKLTLGRLNSILTNSLDKELKSNGTTLNLDPGECGREVVPMGLLLVLFQLILNAQDEENRVTVTVTATCNDQELILKVSDSASRPIPDLDLFEWGVGDKQDRKIYDRYMRKHYGVGLAIARSVLEKSGDTLALIREKDQQFFQITIKKS